MKATQERWLPVVGYEGLYEVSDQGRVRSLDRAITYSDGRRYRHKGRVLRQTTCTRGKYLKVALLKDRVQQTRMVHTLMADAFLGPRPAGLHICHWNDIGTDNRVENLRYDTVSANRYDCVRNGTHFQARKTHCKRDHEFTPENIRWTKGGRTCLICVRESARKARRKYNARKRAERDEEAA